MRPAPMRARKEEHGHERQVLLIDADDTLWENNLHFERAIAQFEELISPLGFPLEEVRREINRIEQKNIRRRGYGARHFVASLEETYLKLAGPQAEKKVVTQINQLIDLLLFQAINVYPGVPETLAYLAPRHRLLLLTKGDLEEQLRKVKLSGLQQFFEESEVLPEKDVSWFRRLVERHRLSPEVTWMVGNSPRSDVNPALAAGLNAVFIPSEHNWDFEQEDLRAGRGTLLVLASFAQLREHF